jgi:hypothetical protein
VGQVTRKNFDVRIRELVTGQATLERIAGAMLSARTALTALKAKYEKLHKAVLSIVCEAAVCRRQMMVLGVGPVVAVTYKSATDDPNRIAKSRHRPPTHISHHHHPVSCLARVDHGQKREPGDVTIIRGLDFIGPITEGSGLTI